MNKRIFESKRCPACGSHLYRTTIDPGNDGVVEFCESCGYKVVKSASGRISNNIIRDTIEPDHVIEFSKYGKYLFVFENPLPMDDEARIKEVLTEWIESSQPIAVISGVKFRIIEKPETVEEQLHDR